MKYIIAVVGGVRKDLAPEYKSEFGKVYEYGSFNLIIRSSGDWDKDYEKAYEEVSNYVAKCNNVFKGNRYYNAWIWAEMLTPKEQGQYNDIHCELFHSWFATEILKADEIIVTKTNICGKDLHDRLDVWQNIEEVAKIARVVSTEMLRSIHLPGDYMHSNYVNNSDLFLKDYPIFEFGFNLPYSIQIVDRGLHTKLWLKENR